MWDAAEERICGSRTKCGADPRASRPKGQEPLAGPPVGFVPLPCLPLDISNPVLITSCSRHVSALSQPRCQNGRLPGAHNSSLWSRSALPRTALSRINAYPAFRLWSEVLRGSLGTGCQGSVGANGQADRWLRSEVSTQQLLTAAGPAVPGGLLRDVRGRDFRHRPGRYTCCGLMENKGAPAGRGAGKFHCRTCDALRCPRSFHGQRSRLVHHWFDGMALVCAVGSAPCVGTDRPVHCPQLTISLCGDAAA